MAFATAGVRPTINNRRLSRTRAGQVFVVENLNFDRRHISESRQAVLAEARVEHLFFVEVDRLKQRPAAGRIESEPGCAT